MSFTYKELKIKNSFNNAPVLYTESTASTMDDAKYFSARGALAGTVVCAGFQTKGRGRFKNRYWTSRPDENLLFTLILKKDSFPFSFLLLPVITGLALCVLFEEYHGFSPMIKWPNDILYKDKKLAGILCEAEKENIFCGIGINCNQIKFPDFLSEKAVSLAVITGKKINIMKLCKQVLSCIKNTFSQTDWREMTEKRLYKKGSKVKVFTQDSNCQGEAVFEGIIRGIAADGGLLLENETSADLEKIIAGEIRYL